MDKLHAEVIRARCARVEPCAVHRFKALPSTNAWLLQRRADFTGPQLCVAETQTAGRGRRGKRWQSPPGGITFSLLRRFTSPVEQLAGLSLVAGCAVLPVLEALGARGLAMKWPNDILHRDEKLCGLLIELGGNRTAGTDTVTGIGLNYRGAGDSSAIGQPFTDLACLLGGRLPDRSILIGELAAAILRAYTCYEREGFAAFRPHWERYDAYFGLDIALSQVGRQTVHGVACGVADNGALKIETDAGLHEFYAGNISIRPLHNSVSPR